MSAGTRADVGIVIALDEEFEAFREVLGVHMDSVPQAPSLFEFEMHTAAHRLLRGIVCLLGEMGPEAATAGTKRLLQHADVGLVVSLGFSGSLSDATRLGDVVVASAADNYAYRGKIETPTDAVFKPADIKFGGSEIPTTSAIATVLRNAPHNNNKAWVRWTTTAGSEFASLDPQVQSWLQRQNLVHAAVRLHSGPTASGPFVTASNQFKQRLLTGRNRNFLAVDMESAAVMRTSHEEQPRAARAVIRGVSDFADDRKKLLEDTAKGEVRAWAMRNATRALRLVFDSFDDGMPLPLGKPLDVASAGAEQLRALLHAQTVREHLGQPYQNEQCLEPHRLKAYQALLCEAASPDDRDPSIVEAALARAVASPSGYPLVVEGDPGTGKTAFLSLFYWLAYQQAANGGPLPVLINLPRYNQVAGRNGIKPTAQQAIDALERHLLPLQRLVAGDHLHGLLLVVDGFDEFVLHRDELLAKVDEICGTCARRRIIGIRPPKDAAVPMKSDAESTLLFRAIPLQTSSAERFVEAYLETTPPGGSHVKAAQVLRLAAESGLREIDLFTVSVLVQQLSNPRAPSSATLAGLMRDHCSAQLRQRLGESDANELDGKLKRAAAMAFTRIIRQEDVALSEPGDTLLWNLLHRHPCISDFLIATHVIAEFEETPKLSRKESDRRLKYVYTQRVNRFCSEIMNASLGKQMAIAKACSKLLKAKQHPYLHAHACYLAGRVTDNQAQQITREPLRRFLEQNATPSNKTTEQLLAVRSAYISLAYLDSRDALEAYVDRLLDDRNWDLFNRGFHLEYYGDQTYISNEPLVSKDSLNPAPKTFGHLEARLARSANPIFEIDLHTFCSLAQHRQAARALDAATRSQVASVIEATLRRPRTVRHERLWVYAAMVAKHLRDDRSVAGLFGEFYGLKRTKRAGWVKRGLDHAETVADHTMGTYLLGLFFLSETSPDKHDKARVLDMLLIHDLAEALTGDVATDDRTDANLKDERRVFEVIRCLGTYPHIADIRRVTDLWNEFETGDTPEARIARDIDRLDNLLQLKLYHAEGRVIPDYAAWRQELYDQIKTRTVRDIVSRLELS